MNLLRYLPLAMIVLGCATSDEATPVETTQIAPISTTLLSPTSDLANASVWGGGGGAPIYALVDDGKSFAAADDLTFARSAPGRASTSITFGYAGAPAGGATRVVVNHRAWALGGASGSVQILLYSGATLVGTGPAHALTATRQNFSDTFANLAVADANQLRTQLVFTNASGGTSSLAVSLVWLEVTSASNELLRAEYPHAFVSNATNQPVRLNGFNLRMTGSNGWAMPQSRFDDIKAHGFNMLRLAMSWNDYEPARGQYAANVLTALDQTIARAKAAGIYIILDPIHANVGPKFPAWAVKSTDANEMQTIVREAVPYLKMLAARYANEPQVVAIDLVNEPQGGGMASQWVFGGYNTLIAAVRPVAPNKILVIEPISGNVDPRKLDFGLITDKTNLIYSLHYYFAGGHTNGYSTEGWATQGNYVWNGTSGYPARNPTQLANHLLVTLDKLATVRLPVWIGEFGAGNGVTNHDAWFEDVVDLFNTHDLSRTQWEYHWGAMAAVDNSYVYYPWTSILTQP